MEVLHGHGHEGRPGVEFDEFEASAGDAGGFRTDEEQHRAIDDVRGRDGVSEGARRGKEGDEGKRRRNISPGNDKLPIRNDQAAMLKVLELVEEFQKYEKDGDELPSSDRTFLKQTDWVVTGYSFFGGICSGGAAFYLTRAKDRAMRIPAISFAWILGAGTGRAFGTDWCLRKLFELKEPSLLGPAARKIVLDNAEEKGFFYQRFKCFRNEGNQRNTGTESLGIKHDLNSSFADTPSADSIRDPLMKYRRTIDTEESTSYEPVFVLDGTSEDDSSDGVEISSFDGLSDNYLPSSKNIDSSTTKSFDGFTSESKSWHDDASQHHLQVRNENDYSDRYQGEEKRHELLDARSIYDDEYDFMPSRLKKVKSRTWDDIRKDYHGSRQDSVE